MQILQTLDISQYEFEEFCEKWAFNFYERTQIKENSALRDAWTLGFNEKEYDKMWDEFIEINPSREIKYNYITKLNTNISFYMEGSWTFKITSK